MKKRDTLWNKLFKPKQSTPLENRVTAQFGDRLRTLGIRRLCFGSRITIDRPRSLRVRANDIAIHDDIYARVSAKAGGTDLSRSYLERHVQPTLPDDPGLLITVKEHGIFVSESRWTKSLFPQEVLAAIDLVIGEIERRVQEKSELLRSLAAAWSEIER